MGIRIETAFSRDQKSKVYVQHKMRQFEQAIWEHFEKGAYFLIAGSAKQMPKDVTDELKSIIQSHLSLMDNEVTELVEKMEKSGRLQFETWS